MKTFLVFVEGESEPRVISADRYERAADDRETFFYDASGEIITTFPGAPRVQDESRGRTPSPMNSEEFRALRDPD